MIKIEVVTVIELAPSLELRSKEKRILQGGIDQTKILDIIIHRGHVLNGYEGVEQRVFIIDL